MAAVRDSSSDATGPFSDFLSGLLWYFLGTPCPVDFSTAWSQTLTKGGLDRQGLSALTYDDVIDRG